MFYYSKHKSENPYDELYKLNTLKEILVKFFHVKSQIVNISGALGHTISVITTEPCCYSTKAATGHT